MNHLCQKYYRSGEFINLRTQLLFFSKFMLKISSVWYSMASKRDGPCVHPNHVDECVRNSLQIISETIKICDMHSVFKDLVFVINGKSSQKSMNYRLNVAHYFVGLFTGTFCGLYFRDMHLNVKLQNSSTKSYLRAPHRLFFQNL